MADLTLNEWDGALEFVIFDFTQWGQGKQGFCNSSRNWTPVLDEDGRPTDIDAPADTLAVDSINFLDLTCPVLPFKTSGYVKGGDTVARPVIEIADSNGALLNRIRGMQGASLAPVTVYRVLAADIDANTGVIIGQPHDYLLNKVSGNGTQLTIELGTNGDTTRSKFPPYSMDGVKFPGLRNATTARNDRRAITGRDQGYRYGAIPERDSLRILGRRRLVRTP